MQAPLRGYTFMMQPPPPPGYPPQPPGYPPQPPGYPQPGYGQVPPPPKNGFVKPLLIGCAAVLVILLVVGGIATYFTMKAVGTALHGASDVAKVAQGAVSSAQQAATEAGASPDPAQAAAAGVAVLKSFVGGGKGHVETLPRDELKADLPATVNSFPRTNSESSRGSFSGISGTTASASYSSGNQSISIDVTDAANMAGLTTLMDVAMSVESEDDSGYQKTVQLGDVKVHEKWETASKNAELIGIVGGRFVVQVTGNGVDMGVNESAFQAVDLAKLEAAAAATPTK